MTNIHVSSTRDVPGFPNPQTADGRPIRTVTYLLKGTANGPVDTALAAARFRQALPGIAAVSAANPDMTTLSPSQTVPPYVAIFGKTQLNDTNAGLVTASAASTATTTAAPTTAVLFVPIVAVASVATTVAPAAAATVTASSATTTTASVPSGLLLLANAPVMVGPGAFTINDTLVLTADTRRARDRIMDDQIKPVWQTVLGMQ